MIFWRVGTAKHAKDLSGAGAALNGGRWNHKGFHALYLGSNPSICCLEAFVNSAGAPPAGKLKLTKIYLPDEPDLYLTPPTLPDGWDKRPSDRASMEFGTQWLRSGAHLGLYVPSVVLPYEINLVINPEHPAFSQIHVIDVYNFTFDPRMFS